MNDQLIGLITHRYFGRNFESSGIDLKDSSELSIRVYPYRTYISRNISKTFIEGDISAIRYVHLSQSLTRTSIEDFDFMRTVDNRIHLGTIYLDIVTHVAQLLYHVRILLGIQVTDIIAVFEIDEIERTFIRTHIPLVQQIKSGIIRPAVVSERQSFIFRQDNDLVFPTGSHQRYSHQQDTRNNMCDNRSHYNSMAIPKR